VSEAVWKKGHRRSLWVTVYRGYDLRIEPCNFGFQWVAAYIDGDCMRGRVADTVEEAQAAAVAAVDAKMK
jgi:hypothetical protein